MRRRTQAIRRTVFAAVAALAVAVSAGAARAADDCLAAPNGATPQGGHWFYRLDHATKRKCWYLGQEGQKTHEAAVKPRQPARSSAPAATETAADSSAPAPAAAAESSAPAPAPEPPVAAARAEAPWPSASAAIPDSSTAQAQPQAAAARTPPQGVAAQDGSAVQTADAGKQDRGVQTPASASPWPQAPAPAAATASESTRAPASALATPPQPVAEPTTGAAVGNAVPDDEAPAKATAAVAQPAAAHGGFGWTLFKVAVGVLMIGVLVYVAFRIPLGRQQRPVRARRTDRTFRAADERASPPLAPRHETDFPRLPMQDEAPRRDPRRDLREILQALERASPRASAHGGVRTTPTTEHAWLDPRQTLALRNPRGSGRNSP